jgi:Uma2 family endonuclease
MSMTTKTATSAFPRSVMRGDYDLYDRLTDAIGERSSFRLAYDGTEIELTTLGPKHEDISDLLSLFVTTVAVELYIDVRGLGATTWKRREVNRGIEADRCYYFDPVKLETARDLESNDVGDYRNPDLAIEVDISIPLIDRPAIYSALKVSEVWRWEEESITIEQLGHNGANNAATVSRFLPVAPDEVRLWIGKGLVLSRRDWLPALSAWVQKELKPRVAPSLDPLDQWLSSSVHALKADHQPQVQEIIIHLYGLWRAIECMRCSGHRIA